MTGHAPAGSTRPARAETYLFFFVCFGLIIYLSHAGLLDLPYHWDELGHFVPASLDLFREGRLIPVHTQPNVHPPGLAAYLGLVWLIFGYSLEATRAAMLALATGAALASFLLMIQLTRHVPGVPAFVAVILLLVSPLFFTQSMMAQLDLPAMLFSMLALLWFLQGRIRLCFVACVLLVLSKETGVAVPAVLAAWSAKDRKRSQAVALLVPALILAGWLIVLAVRTGNPLGNRDFAIYNVLYPLHPVRIATSLLRRASYLFLEEFRWIGAVALVAGWRNGMFRTRPWKIGASWFLAHVLLVSFAGGAALERYLLPVLPLLYAAFAAGFIALGRRTRVVGITALVAGLAVSNVWSPGLWPSPHENNLAVVDFVKLQQTAAHFLDRGKLQGRVVSAWPFADAVRSPDFGYVSRPIPALKLADFSRESMNSIVLNPSDIVVLYSRDNDPPHNILHSALLEPVWSQYFHYRPPVDSSWLCERFHLVPVARWTRAGNWIAVYVRY